MPHSSVPPVLSPSLGSLLEALAAERLPGQWLCRMAVWIDWMAPAGWRRAEEACVCDLKA